MSKKVDIQDGANEARIYEVGYLVSSAIAEEKVAPVVDQIRSAVEGASGEIIAEGSPKLMDLAYTMSTVVSNKKHTFDRGYFGWVKFEVLPDKTDSIKQALDKNTDLIRYIIVKTVREDTMSQLPAETPAREESPKPSLAAKAPEVKVKKEEPKQDLSPEEIDETIDKLVID